LSRSTRKPINPWSLTLRANRRAAPGTQSVDTTRRCMDAL
jgi:hypothetical protein